MKLGRGNSNGRNAMAEDPLKVSEQLDPDVLNLVRQASELALADGAWSEELRFLIGEGC